MNTAEEQDPLAGEDQLDPQLPTGEDAGQGGEDTQDDIETLLNDPEAFEKADKALATAAGGEAGEGGEAGDKDEARQPATAAALAGQGAPGNLDPDPVVETITYRGQAIPVRKSQSRDLMQKGRHLEVVLEHLTPLRVIGEDQELMTLARKIQRLPKGKEALKHAMREAFEQALPEIDGYSKEDVAGASRLLRPLLEAEGVLADGSGRDPLAGTDQPGEAIGEADQIRIEAHLKAAIVNEPSLEDAAKTLEAVNAAILEADRAAPLGQLKDNTGRVIPPEEWQHIRAAINDPRRPEVFHSFFKQIGEHRRAGGRKVVVKAGTLPAGGNQDRMAPGAAAVGGKPGKLRDAYELSDEEFERTLHAL